MIATEFLRFARSAAVHQLEYMVIGGLALNLHRILRNTIDSDLWLNPTQPNLTKLGKVLKDLDYEEENLKPLLGLNLLEPNVFALAGPIDILTHVHRDFAFSDCFERVFIFRSESLSIPVLSLEDLRELKIRVRREQDLRDVILIDGHIRANG